MVSPALEWLEDSLDLRELLQECADAQSHVLVDLSDVGGMDSLGLGLLMRFGRLLADHDRRLVLFSAREELLRVLRITGADRLLITAPDEVGAMRVASSEQMPRSS